MSGVGHGASDALERLARIEVEIDMLKQRQAATASVSENTLLSLQTLVKDGIEAKALLNSASLTLEGLKKEIASLETYSESVHDRSQAELREFAETIVDAFADISRVFKESIGDVSKSNAAEINDLKKRISTVEKFQWLVTGGAALLGTIVGIVIPFTLHWLRTGTPVSP